MVPAKILSKAPLLTWAASALITGLVHSPVSMAAGWETFDSTDEMTGKKTHYAISPEVSTTRPMDFPYRGVKGSLSVGCSGSDEWAYFVFSKAPNLNGTTNGDGYNRIRTRVKWGDTVVRETLTQDWGSRFIHFADDDSAIHRIAAESTVMLELTWHGQGAVHFPFTLQGSSNALSKIRSQCSMP